MNQGKALQMTPLTDTNNNFSKAKYIWENNPDLVKIYKYNNNKNNIKHNTLLKNVLNVLVSLRRNLEKLTITEFKKQIFEELD